MLYLMLGFVTAAIVYRGVRSYPGEEHRSWAMAGFATPLIAALFGGRFASDLLIMSGRVPTDDGASGIVHATAFAAIALTTAAMAIAPRYVGIGAPAPAEQPAPATPSVAPAAPPIREQRTITSV